jgi:hypothetical protein
MSCLKHADKKIGASVGLIVSQQVVELVEIRVHTVS